MWDHIYEFLGFGVGLLYLWWEYHADSKMWFASVVMPLISMWIYFSKGLYADFAINIYYLVIAVYGFIVWTRGKGHATADSESAKKGHPITHVPATVAIGCIAAGLLLWWIIWWLLDNYTDSKVAVADAFTTAYSIVGLWMLARKYAEQWLVWLIVDIVCTALYFYKGIYFYSVHYAIYTIIAALGYRKWLRMMQRDVASQ